MFALLQRLRHKPLWALMLLVLFVFIFDKTAAQTEAEPQQTVTTTPEPDASPGCKAPDIRFTIVRPDTTTEQSFAKFETTQLYQPEDLTTSENDFMDKMHIDLNDRRTHDNQMDRIVNPYQVDTEGHHHDMSGLHVSDDIAAFDDDEDDEDLANVDEATRKRIAQNRKLNKNRRSGGGRRRRLENENGETRGRGGRYKRQAIHHDPEASADTDKWNGGKLAAEGDVYYVHIDDILKSKEANPELRYKLHKLKKRTKKSKGTKQHKNDKCNGDNADQCSQQQQLSEQSSKSKKSKKAMGQLEKKSKLQKMSKKQRQHHRRRGDSHEDKHEHEQEHERKLAHMSAGRFRRSTRNAADQNNDQDQVQQNVEQKEVVGMKPQSHLETTSSVAVSFGNDTIGDGLLRVKRKSGKTTGALSRPKGGGDSGSKTTSRKDKGVFDEDSGYSPSHPDEVDEDEEDEDEEEIDIQQQFTEVSEIRFPGEIGPLGDRRLCKIRCVKGKWVGPLCATNEEDDHGNVQFQPLYKSCHVNRIPPHLLLSYRNISVNVGWELPHGHSLQARCKDLGLYKLLGESRVLCSNGLWAPRMPNCVPTTLLTNFSDDSPPSIRIKVLNGSGAFEPSGMLAVLPQSTIYLDCIYPRVRGIPEWTWTSWYMNYPTGWSPAHEEKNIRYRLTIKDIEHSDSGTFTCTSPRGLTNSIGIVVATAICPQLPEPLAPLTLRLEGNKLGNRAMYRCPPGFRIDGTANATCLASGNWSSPPPTCQAITCPRLILDDPHLSLVELNTSAWGRAMFKCQWGFKLTGPPGLDCQPTGVWSGPVPRCKAIQCPMPVAPLNGRIGGANSNQRRFTVGALITFSCNEGHTLVGEPSIICTETGVWSHELPFCKSQCFYPGDPEGGTIAPLKFNYDPGDYLSVSCNAGYVPYTENGPLERPKCQPDGHWSAPVPKCKGYEEV